MTFLNLNALIFVISGSAIAFLSTILGIGGGVFTVPLFFFMGQGVLPDGQIALSSITSSLLLALLFSTSASYKNWNQKQISFKHGLSIIMGATIGAGLAALWTVSIDTILLMRVFSIFLLINGSYSFIKILWAYKKNKRKTKLENNLLSLQEVDSNFSNLKYIFLMIAGIGVGLLSSFTGVGGGVIIVPLLLNFVKLDARKAIATSTFCIAFITLAGLVAYYFQSLSLKVLIPEPRIGFLYLPMVIPLIIGGIFGGYYGSHFTRKIPSFYLIVLLASLQIIIALKIIIL